MKRREGGESRATQSLEIRGKKERLDPFSTLPYGKGTGLLEPVGET